jgi:hypothetical protein
MAYKNSWSFISLITIGLLACDRQAELPCAARLDSLQGVHTAELAAMTAEKAALAARLDSAQTALQQLNDSMQRLTPAPAQPAVRPPRRIGDPIKPGDLPDGPRKR